MKINSKLNTYISLLLYLTLSLFSILPFFKNGFFTVHDDVQVARIYEMSQALLAGQFPVRWVGDLGYGFGYPLFNFYSVLPYYLGGFINILGLDALFSTKLVFIFGIVASGISMFWLVRTFFGNKAALASSIIYLYFPYHAVNVYVRGALAETFAYAFLPLVLLSLFKIHSLQKLHYGYIALGVFSLVVVVLSHNLSAFIFLPFILIFILYSLITSKNKFSLSLAYSITLLFGFLISAFYILPAVLESQYTNISKILGGGSNPLDHFVCLNQLWESQWGFAGSTSGCVDGMSFKLGKLNIILTLFAVIYSFMNITLLKEKRFVFIISLFLFIISVFMLLSLSAFIWNLPFMEYLQFPWRFLNMAGLFISILIGIGVWLIEQKFKKNFAIISTIIIIILTLVFNSNLFKPQTIHEITSQEFTNEFYLNWSASKISDEYLPSGFRSPSVYQENLDLVSRFDTQNPFYKLNNNRNGFSFEQTNIQIISNIITIISLALFLAVIIFRPLKLKLK